MGVNLYGVRTSTNFEVIESVDGTNPYQTLMGIDWAFDNFAIIDLIKRKIIVEVGYV